MLLNQRQISDDPTFYLIEKEVVSNSFANILCYVYVKKNFELVLETRDSEQKKKVLNLFNNTNNISYYVIQMYSLRYLNTFYK